MVPWYDRYKVDVPEGASGQWQVERFTVTEAQAKLDNLQSAVHGCGHRWIRPGIYTRLVYGTRVTGTTAMSDTPAEISEHMFFMRAASGNVLIHGLGLGVVLQGCLENGKVERATVVEKDPDVIKLVAPHYQARFGCQFELVEGDAFTWKLPPGRRWTCAWHDIWPHITPDNLPEMHRLHRRFGRRVDWQRSWARDQCERLR